MMSHCQTKMVFLMIAAAIFCLVETIAIPEQENSCSECCNHCVISEKNKDDNLRLCVKKCLVQYEHFCLEMKYRQLDSRIIAILEDLQSSKKVQNELESGRNLMSQSNQSTELPENITSAQQNNKISKVSSNSPPSYTLERRRRAIKNYGNKGKISKQPPQYSPPQNSPPKEDPSYQKYAPGKYGFNVGGTYYDTFGAYSHPEYSETAVKKPSPRYFPPEYDSESKQPNMFPVIPYDYPLIPNYQFYPAEQDFQLQRPLSHYPLFSSYQFYPTEQKFQLQRPLSRYPLSPSYQFYPTEQEFQLQKPSSPVIFPIYDRYQQPLPYDKYYFNSFRIKQSIPEPEHSPYPYRSYGAFYPQRTGLYVES